MGLNLPQRAFRDLRAPTGIYKVAVFPDGSHLVVGWLDGTIGCFRTSDGGLEWTRKAVDRLISISISPDSRQVVTGAQIGYLNHPTKATEVWSAKDGNRITSLAGGGVTALSGDGRTLVTEDHTVIHDKGKPDAPEFRVYRTSDWSETMQGPSRKDPPTSIAIDAQGKHLAAIGHNIELWNLGSRPELVREIPLAGSAVSGVFSADASRLMACVDGALTIWNVETGDLLLRMDEDNWNYFGMAKWIGDRIYTLNKGRVTIFDASLKGVEDWEEAARSQAQLEMFRKLAEAHSGRQQ